MTEFDIHGYIASEAARKEETLRKAGEEDDRLYSALLPQAQIYLPALIGIAQTAEPSFWSQFPQDPQRKIHRLFREQPRQDGSLGIFGTPMEMVNLILLPHRNLKGEDSSSYLGPHICTDGGLYSITYGDGFTSPSVCGKIDVTRLSGQSLKHLLESIAYTVVTRSLTRQWQERFPPK